MQKENSLIYFVEDDITYANIIMQVLTKSTLKFKHFIKGEDMLTELEQQLPDICILDFNLGDQSGQSIEMNGLQIMQAMNNKGYNVPVVMLSGIEDVQLAIDTLKYNANDYVVKNENAVVRLEEVINKILDLKSKKRNSLSYYIRSKKLKKHIVLTFSAVALFLFIIIKFL